MLNTLKPRFQRGFFCGCPDFQYKLAVQASASIKNLTDALALPHSRVDLTDRLTQIKWLYCPSEVTSVAVATSPNVGKRWVRALVNVAT